jgi:hypothetical protein
MKINFIRNRYGLMLMVIASLLVSVPALGQSLVNGNENGNSGNNNSAGRRGFENRGNREGQNGPGANGSGPGQNFCQKISDMASQEEKKLSERKNPKDRFANWQEKIGQRDADLTGLRSKWDENRAAQFAKLEEKASTDAQKQAVSEFETSVKAAISARRAAIDVAIATFREGVKNLISQRSEDVSSGFTAFSDAVKAAFDKAISDCKGTSPDAASIRTTLRSSIQEARTKFQQDRQNAPKVGGNIQSLIDARRAAVQKAMDNFKAAMETARANLKKAFPQD